MAKRNRYPRDVLVKDVAHIMREGKLTNSDYMRKTGLVRKTLDNIRTKQVRQPQLSTLRAILKVHDLELVIRPKGSNQ